MNPNLIVLLVALALVAFGLGAAVIPNLLEKRKLTASTCGDVPHPGGTMDPNAHYIGPVLSAEQGGDMSRGMPLHPQLSDDGWLWFDFPDDGGVDLPFGAGAKVDYVTWRNGSLSNFHLLRLRYRCVKDPDALLYAVPEQDPTLKMKLRVTPILIEEGDNFTADAAHEASRWFHEDPDLDYIEEGEHEIVAPLDTGWTATQFSTLNPADKGGYDPQGNHLPEYNPTGFATAIKNTCCVGFVFGGDEIGVGHGGRSRGNVRFYYKITVE